MGKIIKFPIREVKLEGEDSPENIIKAIKDSFTEAQLEEIRQELEGFDDDDNATLN